MSPPNSPEYWQLTFQRKEKMESLIKTDINVFGPLSGKVHIAEPTHVDGLQGLILQRARQRPISFAWLGQTAAVVVKRRARRRIRRRINFEAGKGTVLVK